MMRYLPVFVVPLLCMQMLLLFSDCEAFWVQTASSYPLTRMHASQTKQPQDTDPETLKHDIAELKEQAEHRLENLLEQMEKLKALNDSNSNKSARVATNTKIETPTKQPNRISKTPDTETPTKLGSSVDTAPQTVSKQEDTSTTLTKSEHTPAAMADAITAPAPLNLLDDTVWKIVFNIGRETGTWMPKEWGASGDRLLFQCSVDFTSDLVTNERDEFFQGASSGIKKLAVTDAFVIPRGVGQNSVGRRPLPVKPTGAYKVCRGQGPGGTDIVRLYIELTSPVTLPDHVSDVYCPPGRIYGTCGYFAIPAKHDPKAAPSHRDLVQEEHNEAVRNYEMLQMAVDMDERGMFNLDHLQKMKEAWKAKKVLDETAAKLQLAKQREPEKAQLRLSKAGTVGLTREGGVCCKVHKGLALEYHILGRMEVGFVEDHHLSDEDDLAATSV